MLTCPSCARENAPEFSFCPYCGSPLAAAPAGAGQRARSGDAGTVAERAPAEPRPLSEERKVVTTLFCDLVGFTSLSEVHDHENVDAMLQTYADCARGIVESYGGVVEKFIGDAVVAVFGFPRAHDDDPERAVRAGLKITAEVPKLDWPGDTPLAVRIGINTGETYLHTNVDPQSGETFLTGDAVNTAARLQSAAPPGGVVVGELTYSLSERSFVSDELDALTLKGKQAPVRAWLIQGPVSRTGLRTSGESATPFFGRQRELRALQNALKEAAETHRSQFVLLVGEPGIGKSRLVLEFARLLESGPDLIVWRQGRCLAYGEGVTFWPLGEILKAQAGILDSDDVETVEAKLEAALPEGENKAWLDQRLRPLLGLKAGQSSREESFAAWTQFLAHVASHGPTVLVIEDLHWAGEAMLTFVEHLLVQQLAGPVLILATTRPELLLRGQGPFIGRGGIPEQLDRLTLAPLSGDESGALLATLLDTELASQVDTRIVRLVGGNPLYAEQYVRLLLDRSLLVRGPDGLRLESGVQLPLPDTVQAVLTARLDTLPSEHKALLCDAAVIGETFWGGGVVALSGRAASEVDAAMSALIGRDLVRPVVNPSMEGETEYLFWHALARDVAYAQLPRRVRLEKHTVVAGWLEESAGERAEEFSEILAHHYVTALDLAKALRDRDKMATLKSPTGEYLRRAGEHVLQLDMEATRQYLTSALKLLPKDSHERGLALMTYAEILSWKGEAEEGIETFAEAAQALLACGDRNGAAVCKVEQAQFLQLVGRPWRAAHEEGLALLDRDRPSLDLVYALQEAAANEALQLDPEMGLALTEEALEVSSGLGIPAPPEIYEWRAVALLNLGRPGALEDFERAVREGEAQGIGTYMGRVYHNYAGLVHSMKGPKEGLQAFRQSVEYADRRGMTFWSLAGRTAIVLALADAGEWDQALLEADALEPRIRESAWVLMLANTIPAKLQVLLARGDLAEAQRHEGWLREMAASDVSKEVADLCRLLSASLHAARGERDEALRLQHTLADDLASRPPQAQFALLAARNAFRLGGSSLVERFVSFRPGQTKCDGLAAITVEGLLAEARGNHGGAAETYVEAAQGWHEFGVPEEEAQALIGAGRCLVALGREPEAEPFLERAREIVERLGAKPALDEAEALLAGVA